MSNTYKLEQQLHSSENVNFSEQIGIDINVLNLCAENDRKAQEFVYRKYFDSMIRMCQRYTTDQDELISIVNDGFLKVFKKID